MIILQNRMTNDRVYFNLVTPLWEAYAKRHGYTYVMLEEKAPEGRDEYWAKIPAIIKTLKAAKTGETVLYLDGDTLPIKDEPLDGVLAADIGLVRAHMDERYPEQKEWLNCGVIFMRALPQVCWFFEEALADGQVDKEPGEQDRINKNLVFKWTDNKPVAFDSGPSLQVLDNRYNAYCFAPSPDPVIRAFHGEGDKKNAVRLMGLVLSGKFPVTFGMRI